MSSLNASVILSQVEHLSEIRYQTYENYKHLSAAVSKIKNVRQITDKYSDGFVSYFTIIVSSDRFLFSEELASQGIQSTWNYYPVHKIPCYKQYCKFYCLSLENCESLWQHVISLPFKYPLKEADMDLVCQGIQEGIKNATN